MTDDMVERVARAINPQFWWDGYESIESREQDQEWSRELARAAIKAITESGEYRICRVVKKDEQPFVLEEDRTLEKSNDRWHGGACSALSSGC